MGEITEKEIKEALDYLETRKFSILKKPKFEKACLTVTDYAGVEQRVGNRKHLGVITGKFGSRKTTVASAIAASALSRERVLNFKMDMPNENVLWIDTEQPDDTSYEVTERMFELGDMSKEQDNPRLHLYKLQPNNFRQRLFYTDLLIKHTPNLGLVVIDGIVDLMASINDEQESRAMTDRVLNWIGEYDIMVICIIHTNKDGENERGFIGGFLADKANFVIKVEADDVYSTVKSRKGRYGRFTPFKITNDKEGIPVLQQDAVTYGSK